MTTRHLLRVYETMKTSTRWLSTAEISQHADVNVRTARTHAAALAKAGVLNEARLGDGFLYHFKRADPELETLCEGVRR
jgi:hypothetical protein